MTTETMEYTGTLKVIECSKCHNDFGITPQFDRQRRDDHGTFYCPQGHPQYFPGKSKLEKVRGELARTEGQVVEMRVRAQRAERNALIAKRQASAAKGRVTRMRNLIARGQCPCCKRHFKQVAAHMETQHPDVLAKIREAQARTKIAGQT